MRQIPKGVVEAIEILRDADLKDTVKYGFAGLRFYYDTLLEWEDSGLIDDVLKKIKNELVRRNSMDKCSTSSCECFSCRMNR